MEETKKEVAKSEKPLNVFWIIVLIIVAFVNSVALNGNINIYALIGHAIGSFVPFCLFAFWLANIAKRNYTKNLKIIRMTIVLFIFSILYTTGYRDTKYYPFTEPEQNVSEKQNIEKVETKNYTLKYISFTLPAELPFEEVKIELNKNMKYGKRYIVTNTQDIAIVLEEGEILNDKASSSTTIKNLIAYSLGTAEVNKIYDKIKTQKIGNIEQSSCVFEDAESSNKIVCFAKDDKYVLITTVIEKDNNNAKKIVDNLLSNIQLLF